MDPSDRARNAYLCDRCSYESVVEASYQKLVQNTRRSSIICERISSRPLLCCPDTLTYRHGYGPSERDPGVVDCQRQPADAQQAILSLELVLVTGGVDNLMAMRDGRFPVGPFIPIPRPVVPEFMKPFEGHGLLSDCFPRVRRCGAT